MKRTLFTVVAYVASTLLVQGTSHFAVNADHYAMIPHLRHDPILALGIGAMLVQGALMAYLYPRLPGAGRSLAHALRFAWVMGAFLLSYMTLGEAGKYTVPSVGSWIAVETVVAAIQFTLFGLLLGLIHRWTAVAREARRFVDGVRS